MYGRSLIINLGKHTGESPNCIQKLYHKERYIHYKMEGLCSQVRIINIRATTNMNNLESAEIIFG